MELQDLLGMDMGSVADWIEDNANDYKLIPVEPQWKYCDSAVLPEEDDQMYWVRNNLNGDIEMCRYIKLYLKDCKPFFECWVSLHDAREFPFDNTSWIMIEKPEY